MSDQTGGMDAERRARPLSDEVELLFEDSKNTVHRIDPDATARPGQSPPEDAGRAGSKRFQARYVPRERSPCTLVLC